MHEIEDSAELMRDNMILHIQPLHKAVAAHQSLSQLHACSTFQFERTSVASFLYCCAQWLDIKKHFSIDKTLLFADNKHEKYTSIQALLFSSHNNSAKNELLLRS